MIPCLCKIKGKFHDAKVPQGRKKESYTTMRSLVHSRLVNSKIPNWETIPSFSPNVSAVVLRFLLRKRFTLEDYRWRSPRSRFDFFLTVLRSFKSQVSDCHLRSAESELKRGADLNRIRQVRHC